MRRGPCLILLCLAACAGRTPERAKPGAPATLALDARPLAAGRFAVTLAATARADLDDLILELRLPEGVALESGGLTRAVGPTAAGQTATLVIEVRAPGRAELIGGARLAGGGARGTVATSIVLAGAAKAAVAAGRVVSTPLGPVTEAHE
jgi:hypothetical protein